MDEPLAHLDAKLRNAMRTELKGIQASFGTTSIYVTHDFMEAMSLGNRIAIIDKGHVIQVGTGDEIYYMPKNEFVSQLMGDPEINLIKGSIEKTADGYVFTMENGGKRYDLPKDEDLFAAFDSFGKTGTDMGIRPQNVRYSFEPKEGYLQCTVYSYESIGNKSVINADYNGSILRMIAPNGLQVNIDETVYVDLQLDHAMFFDGETGEYLSRYDEARFKALAASEEG
jgi:ABC-type sugar transport system ATPase subunit